jgi:hypothetical protein
MGLSGRIYDLPHTIKFVSAQISIAGLIPLPSQMPGVLPGPAGSVVTNAECFYLLKAAISKSFLLGNAKKLHQLA